MIPQEFVGFTPNLVGPFYKNFSLKLVMNYFKLKNEK